MTTTSLARPARPARSEQKPQPRRHAWLREPLLHFAIAGAALFALDHALVARADDPRTIVVGAEVEREARELFKGSRGREPNAQELRALRQAWLDNEVLYREGLAMQVDRGDAAIRERVIFKALSVVDASLKRPPLDDARLRQWFEQHRDKYDEPPRVDFQEAVPAGTPTEAQVRALVETLNHGDAQGGELGAGLRVFKGRPHANLVDGYGPEFAQALEAAPAGAWQALRAKDGWRAVKLEQLMAGKPASYDTLRGVVLHDWTDEVMAQQRTDAVRALGKKYTVRDVAEAAASAPKATEDR